MTWSDVPVLVTGAGGFIGSHLVSRLVDAGARVRGFIRYNSRGDDGLLSLLPREQFERVTRIPGDLRDADAVRDAAEGVAVIFHLGAIIPIPYSYIHPREVVETNVTGTLNVLAAARALGNIRVVHTSTSEVYGTARYVPIDEAHPLQGQSPYAASKIGADKLAESYHLSYDLPVVTVRPFNAYGPRQSMRAIIPTIITQALTQDRIRVGDVTPTRDFNYVEDLAEAFLLAGQSDAAVGKTLNVGTGREISIGALIQHILTLVGRDLPLVTESERLRPGNSEVRRLLADARQAEAILGWRPRVTLEEGLQRTIVWMQDHLDRYRPEVYQV